MRNGPLHDQRKGEELMSKFGMPGVPAEEQGKEISRERTIVRTSIIGIVVNVLLAGFKAVVGILSHSIAITLDAVNNISDAASSVITIIGTKLAGRAPDKKHPFGYGRIEYLSAMIISLIVLYAGITSFTESIKKIIEPETPDYSTPVLIIVAVAVVVKIVLGTYVKGVGKKVNSDSLVNSGEDARLDSVISAATLAAAIIFMLANVSLEAWLGAVISVIIIKSGIEMLRDTLSQILGERADASLAREIKDTILSFEEVNGVFDLVLNNYGPDTYLGSVHISVKDTMSMNELDALIRSITEKVYCDHKIAMTAVGIYSVNTKDSDVIEMREKISAAVLEDPDIREFHGFYLYEEKKIIRFDLVVSLGSKDRRGIYMNAIAKVKEMYPGYEVIATLDTDFSEE